MVIEVFPSFMVLKFVSAADFDATFITQKFILFLSFFSSKHI